MTSRSIRHRKLLAPEWALAITITGPSEQKLDGPLLSHRDFLLQRMIGAGQMGKVYQARLISTRQTVAVKFLRKSYLNQPGVVERFIGEARTIARLSHPNIVGIHGLGRTSAAPISSSWNSYRAPIWITSSRQGPSRVEEAIQWTIENCAALEHAHARGSSIAISSRRISCSMKADGSGSPISAWRGR